MEIFENLGINWKILLGQLINFLLILYLLKRFAWGPFLKILKARKEKIEIGVGKEKEIEEKLQALEKERGKILKENQEKADLILKEIEEKAKKKEEEILNEFQRMREKTLNESRAEGKREIERMKVEETKNVLDLSFSLAEKILKEKINTEKDKEIIRRFLAQIENEQKR